MENAHKTIDKVIDIYNAQQLYDMLQVMQESAIQIGNEVEQSEGENHPIVKKLETYCELVWLCSQEENRQEKLKINKKLSRFIIQIYSQIKNEIPEKVVCLFLPYQASMWDSLESIWNAAKDYEGCECYVMPIPYYDKNPDGSIGNMHYDGMDFPDYVPITSWEQIDLRQLHPDFTFIHNPYDQFNNVTTIDPDYYVKNLKEVSEMVIYSPYFISGMYLDAEAFNNKILVPSLLLVDKIVTQSKEQYDLYIKIGINADKLILSGSPKFDAYVNLDYKGIEIPKEWKEKIGNNKVIIINTSIGHMLKFKTYMDFLTKTLNFLASQEGITLIWRPHPLFESTIKRMRSEWMVQYKSNIESIKSKGAIIDEFADNKIATVASDGMISDMSSWTRQYMITGKPVLFIRGKREYFRKCIPTFDESIAYYRFDGFTMKNFCDMILNDEDYEKQQRIESLKGNVLNIDGNAGKRVIEALMKEDG
jgi:hypothetical protein